MKRIRIKDIKASKRIMNNVMKLVRGGACPEGMVIMKGLGCVTPNHLTGMHEKNDMPKDHKRIITDKIYDNLDNPKLIFAVSMKRNIA